MSEPGERHSAKPFDGVKQTGMNLKGNSWTREVLNSSAVECVYRRLILAIP